MAVGDVKQALLFVHHALHSRFCAKGSKGRDEEEWKRRTIKTGEGAGVGEKDILRCSQAVSGRRLARV